MRTTQTVFFAHHCSSSPPNESTVFSTFHFNPADHDDKWALVHQCEVTFDVDPAVIAPLHVAALQDKIKEVQAEAEHQITQLKTQIANLLAISYSPAPAVVADRQAHNDIPF